MEEQNKTNINLGEDVPLQSTTHGPDTPGIKVPQQPQSESAFCADSVAPEKSASFSPENDHEPASIFVPVSVGGPLVHKNSGMRIFVVILCAVISICLALTGGYIAGRSFKNGANISINTVLAEKPDISEQQTTQQVYETVKQSVVGVLVYSKDGKSQSSGSGIIYTTDGYIVTNDHLMADISSPSFFVTTWDGKEYKAEFVAGDARSDVAVLKIQGSFTPAVLGDSDAIAMGEKVITVGYPAGALEKPILTTGTISSTGRRVTSSASSYSTKLIQTDAAINPGNSGGGLVNMYSQIIGITSSKAVGEEYDRIGFAIPSKTVKKVADSLINNGNVKDRAKLGVSYSEVNAIAAELNDLPKGLYVVEIAAESDLSSKGVVAGDVITHINDTPIDVSSIALDIIDSCKAGDVLNLTVYKASNGSNISVTVTLISDPGSSSYTESIPDSSGSAEAPTFDFPLGE